MSFSNIFASLAIDRWYKAFVYLGGSVLIVGFFVEAKGITNAQLQMLSGGVFLFGIGEWKNHKVAVRREGCGFLEIPVRSADWLGITLDFIGVVLIILGMGSIMKEYFT